MEVHAKALREEGLEVRYSTKSNLEEEEDQNQIEVKNQDGHWVSLDTFFEDGANKSRHEYIRQNVLSLTRCFNQRVKAFFKEIVMAKDSPLCVLRYSYKTEFQNRGAAHIHGVLWLNLSKLEKENPKLSGLKEAYDQLKKEAGFSMEQGEVVARFVDLVSTVSLCPAEVGADVVRIAKDTNNHHHTKKACRKRGGPDCR